jgi:hypothetical protein
VTRGCVRKLTEMDDWQRAQVVPPSELSKIFPSKGAWAWARRNKMRFGIESAFRRVGRLELGSPSPLVALIGAKR